MKFLAFFSEWLTHQSVHSFVSFLSCCICDCLWILLETEQHWSTAKNFLVHTSGISGSIVKHHQPIKNRNKIATKNRPLEGTEGTSPIFVGKTSSGCHKPPRCYGKEISFTMGEATAWEGAKLKSELTHCWVVILVSIYIVSFVSVYRYIRPNVDVSL